MTCLLPLFLNTFSYTFETYRYRKRKLGPSESRGTNKSGSSECASRRETIFFYLAGCRPRFPGQAVVYYALVPNQQHILYGFST